MGLKGNKIFLLIFVFFVNSATVEASWQGPQVLISEGWGHQPDQFGIEYGDSGDVFPKDIIILANSDIWISDSWVNERLKLYDSNGSLKKIIALDKTARTFSEYWFIGKFAAFGSDGTVYMSDYMGKRQYAQYSSTGQLLKTYTERPLELGKVKSNRTITGDGDVYKITVTYPDKVYQLASDREFMRYMRISDKVYGINPGGLWRFGQCGKAEGSLLMPVGQKETVAPPELGGKSVALPVQYGEPVVGPNGDVYTWKKSMLKYSIVKWTWVDDPNVPTGPDAPSGLTVTPSINGLYLTWKASPNDPGCVTKYELARSTTSGGVFSTIDTVEKGVLKYNDTTAETGTTYYYKVRAMAGSEYSQYTTEVSGKK